MSDGVTGRDRARGGVQGVTRRLLDLLSSGELLPGRRLPSERDLAERLGVGRATVREALATLEIIGVLETRQGAGSFVTGTTTTLLPQAIEWGLLLDQPETRDLVEARSLLERLSVELAAQRAAPEDLERLRGCLEEMEGSRSDSERFVDADVRFHFEIARMSGNSVVAAMLHNIRSLLEVWIRRASQGDKRAQETLVEHRRIFDAISTGNAELARGAMAVHMDSAAARLQSSLSPAEPAGGGPGEE